MRKKLTQRLPGAIIQPGGDYMANVGKNIAAARRRAGITQEELASRVGYKTKSAINKIELGIRDLPQKKIAAFADALGVTPGHLMGWDEKPAEDLQDMGALAAEVIMDPDAMEMVKKYLAMDKLNRQAVQAFMALSDVDRYALQLVMASMGAKEKTASAEAPAVDVLHVDVE
jgi:transcriptional regulator with XRE-family HTH domain